MRAGYPITPKPGTRTRPANILWCEPAARGKKYFLDGMKFSAQDTVSKILSCETRTIIFFSDLREQVGKLIPFLLEQGQLVGAGDMLRSLHWVTKSKTIFLADASLYFFNPTPALMQELNLSLYEAMRVRLAPTPGNTAMRIMRRFVDIRAMWQPSDVVRALSRPALTGGALHWQTGDFPHVYKYDIHSAYAWSMRDLNFPLRPRTHLGMPNVSADGFILIASVDYHTDKKFSPMVIYGEDAEAYHPTQAENVTMALNHMDIQTLMAEGELNIKRVLASITWTDGPPVLNETMNRIEKLQNDNAIIKPALKIIRNACFGKFAEHDEMSTLTMKIYSREIARNSEMVDIIVGGNTLYALVRERKFKPAPQHNPIFAGLITAKIRQVLYGRVDDDTIYTDTDGLISTSRRPELEQSEASGQWYLDGAGHGIILGPRIYGLGGKNKIAGQHEHVSVSELTRALSQEIRVFETINPNPMRMEKIKTSMRTLRSIKYPIVTARNGFLFVTRSPTIRIMSKLPNWL